MCTRGCFKLKCHQICTENKKQASQQPVRLSFLLGPHLPDLTDNLVQLVVTLEVAVMPDAFLFIIGSLLIQKLIKQVRLTVQLTTLLLTKLYDKFIRIHTTVPIAAERWKSREADWHI